MELPVPSPSPTLPTALSPRRQQLSLQRDAMYAELQSVLEDGVDPIAAYDNLVRWTLQSYVNHSDSGLLELLEESARTFKDDVRYNVGDLRYVKIWILFANYVEKPTLVYGYMMENEIGKPYSLFFEEYAEALEREGRYMEAETVIMLGIRAQAKPLKHLQNFQSDYLARRAAGKLLPTKFSPFREGTCSATLNTIRTDPLQKIARRPPGQSRPSTSSIGHHDISTTSTQSIQPTHPNLHPHPNAPRAPGKRPERLMFNVTLLLGPDGTEYSFEECRARHLGLLGKKWPPPPPFNAEVANRRIAPIDGATVKERSVKVDFNDHSSKRIRPRRQSVTVTINTKQALEDVFDMYNSPVKEDDAKMAAETKLGIEEAHDRPSVIQDENAGVIPVKPRAFQPYVDPKRENITPGPLKFKPTITKTPAAPNAFTPNFVRKALVAKELVTPVPVFKVVRPQQDVITPVVADTNCFKQAPSNVDHFEDGDATNDDFTEDLTNAAPSAPPPRSFVPFVDDNTEIHLSPASQSNKPAPTTSKILKFQVHRDENAPPANTINGPAVGERTPFQVTPRPLHQEELSTSVVDEGSHGPDSVDFQEVEDRRFAISSRFANFDVMTPITERTFEFTVSTRAIDTPRSDSSSMFDRGFVALDAQDVAEHLAAELQEDDARDRIDRTKLPIALASEFPDLEGADEWDSNYALSSHGQMGEPFRISDGFIIEPDHNNLPSSSTIIESTTMNLEGVSDNQSKFRHPNPCNPSDPDIVFKLLSLLPVDPNLRDLQDRTANNLNKMQRFVEKRARRGSGASKTGRISDDSEGLGLELDGDLFEVYDKLGEGGFGAVFLAKDLNKARQRLDEEESEEEANEDDDLVAVKAVRPTNLWESYMLRRVIAALPEDLRHSIIRPHCLYAYCDESFLILDLCQQGTLLEIVNRATEIGIAQPGGGVDELLVMFFTVELLRILQGLHDHGFIHGDLKIDNCLIRLEEISGGPSAWSGEYSPTGEGGWASKGIKLIDFGRTIETKLYPEGQTFVADWKTDARDCLEMREGRPWTYQTDYSGLASIIFCMLFGKYMETVESASPEGSRRVRCSQPMKRYWQVDLWNRIFDVLLNPCQVRPDESLPITAELLSLRRELETWIQGNCNKSGKNLKGMLKKIEIASLRSSTRK